MKIQQFKCKACTAVFRSKVDLFNHHKIHEASYEDTMERPPLNRNGIYKQGKLSHFIGFLEPYKVLTLDSAPIVKMGIVKRPKLDEDDFDMVLNTDNDTSVRFALPRLEPIKLEDITQEDRITMIQTPGRTEMEKVKIFFRNRYPEYAGRWDQDDNWLECPVQVHHTVYFTYPTPVLSKALRILIRKSCFDTYLRVKLWRGGGFDSRARTVIWQIQSRW